MLLRFARISLISAGFALAPLALATIAPQPVEAQAFSALRQAIAEAAASDESLVAFYRDRAFAPVWTDRDAADRRNALVRALEQAGNHGLPADRYDVDGLRAAFRDATNPYLRGQADVMASRLFLRYANDVHGGFLDPSEHVPDIFQDQPHRDPYALLAGFLESNPHEFISRLPPRAAGYTRLMRMKFELEALAASGGYGPTVPAETLRPGDSGELLGSRCPTS